MRVPMSASNEYVVYLHRGVFSSLLLVSFVWCLYALRANPLEMLESWDFWGMVKVTYVIGFSAVFWPMIYIEGVDYIYSRMGKNGRQNLEHSKSLQKDLVVATLTALALACIYWLDSVSYGLTGIDIAFVGLPLLVNALYTLVQCTRVKIAGEPVRKKAIFINFCFVFAFIAVTFRLLINNSSGELESDQALFFQVTVVLCGLHFFLTTNFMHMAWRQGRIETSAFKHYFFNQVIKSKNGWYNIMEAEMVHLNRRLRIRKAKYAQEMRKRQKKKRS
ncbi:hypothetical protein IFT47_17695 [Pseudomonas sp. CFBP 13711]|uniref:hypothetical protein n=1 Tax=unclassified Pseudomonas TaxID=196821 RepID=UPI0017829263|nr:MULTISPECIES: hypothetical protein [unclassified Pseudomonas]MBD8708466.1 hypothetical protein [Pseudomonas sp. CFBP 13711]MBD8713908.1 hypothetical protein [Pseudomonas sp. CFBP 13715]